MIFDEPSLVADAGLIVPATFIVRLGLEALVNTMVHLGGHLSAALVPGARCSPWSLQSWPVPATSTTPIAYDRQRGRVLRSGDQATSTLGTFFRVHLRAHPPARRGDRRSDPPSLVPRGAGPVHTDAWISTRPSARSTAS